MKEQSCMLLHNSYRAASLYKGNFLRQLYFTGIHEEMAAAWLSNCSLFFCLGQPLDHYVHHNGALAKSTKNPVSHPAIVEKAVFHLTNLAGKALHTRLFRCFDILNLVQQQTMLQLEVAAW